MFLEESLDKRESRDNSEAIPIFDIYPPTGWSFLDLRELWAYRELIYFLTWRDIKVRYKQTAIGVAWAVLQPLAMIVVFTLLFGRDGSLIRSVVESNAIESSPASSPPFSSIPMTSRSGIPPRVNTAYPEGFIGPAPYNPNNISLSRLQRLRVEYLVGDILRGLDHSAVRIRFSPWEKLAISLAILLERITTSNKV